MSRVELCIAIPAFNERNIIVETVSETISWMEGNLPNVTFEVLVIDDGSTDGMFEQLAAISAPSLRVIRHPQNSGRGQAVLIAFNSTNSDFLICLDADLSYAPEHIKSLYEPLRDNVADLVLASAYHPEGRVENVPTQRAWLSRVGNKILARSFKNQFHTVTCVARGYRRGLLDSLELVSTDKELNLEILHKALLLNFRVVEKPATLKWRDQKRGRKTGLAQNFVFFSMRQSIISHINYNYGLRPSSILLIPTTMLFLMIIYGMWTIVKGVVSNFIAAKNVGFFDNVYLSVRQSLIDGQLTLVLIIFALVSLMIFAVFYFLAEQAKRNFEEQFVMLSRLRMQLRELKQGKDR